MDRFLPLTESNRFPLIIAGPCSAETRGQVLATARGLADAGVEIFRAGVWKPRTRPGMFEGIGPDALEWLAEVKAETGMRVATEVATAAHVEACLRAGVDILWLGARTTSNPFAVQEVADALKGVGDSVAVMVKNPLSPDVELWAGAIERICMAGLRRIAAVHRGFVTYGPKIYRNAPLWSIPLELSVRYPGLMMIHDPSHTGGRRDLIGRLSQEALDLGFSGLIIESHCAPDSALSDSSQQITPAVLGDIIRKLKPRRHTPSAPAELEELRRRIDSIDLELLDVLQRRMAVSEQIGLYKRDNSMSVLQSSRFNDLIADRRARGAAIGLDPHFLDRILHAIHDASVDCQLKLLRTNKTEQDAKDQDCKPLG